MARTVSANPRRREGKDDGARDEDQTQRGGRVADKFIRARTDETPSARAMSKISAFRRVQSTSQYMLQGQQTVRRAAITPRTALGVSDPRPCIRASESPFMRAAP